MKNNNFEINFTRIKKIYEVNNSMCHNFYFQYNGRIYNESKTKYRQFVFVLWFDIFDVMEFFDADAVTQEDIKEYAKEYGWRLRAYSKKLRRFRGLARI